jgi:hypothetical protein
MTTLATGNPTLVSCTKCGTKAPLGTKTCLNPTCHCWLPGNAGRTPEIPGLPAAQRGDREAMLQQHRDSHDQNLAVAIADRGGDEAVSIVELGLIVQAVTLQTTASILSGYLLEVGPLTPRGRVRTAVAAYNAAVDRYSKLAEKLGLERRGNWRQAHAEAQARMEAAEYQDEDPDEDDDLAEDDE